MKRPRLLLACLLAIYTLSGCALSPVDVDATVTAIAADVYAAQTAALLTPAVGPIHLEADGSGQYATLKEAVRAALILGPGSYRLAASLEIDKSLIARPLPRNSSRLFLSERRPLGGWGGYQVTAFDKDPKPATLFLVE
ncbi:MAG: hypothetical protein DRJ03_23555 [Chloroflexi bacterium]|nr:MAG: hypothetical protein DRJ03_23555 [Chloroflexota bacterium]